MKQVTKDGMLLVLLPTPFLVGLIFKFGVPFTNSVLENTFSFSLLPWYGLVDGMLAGLTPMFVAMISAFLLLEERDEGISAFYQITPAEGYSYLAARIGLPMTWALVTTNISLMIFNISALSMSTILAASLVSSLTGISLAMMIVSIAGNRVEGLALSKLTGVSFLGLILVWFVSEPYSYFSAWLPSFWIGKLIMEEVSFFSFSLGIISCLLWIAFFTRKFIYRIS